VTFTNDGPSAVTPRLSSEITPGGFGVYAALNIADPSTLLISNINNSPPLNSPFLNFDAFGNASNSDIAGVAFSIRISSGGAVVESLSAALTISPAVELGQNQHPAIVTLSAAGDTATALNNFGLVQVDHPDSQVGYQWDATDLLFTLPGGPLEPGESRTVTYETQVTAFTLANLSAACGGQYACPELFAYSGFGDPIGKGGGSAALVNPFAQSLDPSAPTGVSFPRFSFGIPTFDSQTGLLSLPLSADTLPSLPLGTGVPEPAAWAMTLAGLGALGAVLRRRRGLLGV
jgi:hypothetical protein